MIRTTTLSLVAAIAGLLSASLAWCDEPKKEKDPPAKAEKKEAAKPAEKNEDEKRKRRRERQEREEANRPAAIESTHLHHARSESPADTKIREALGRNVTFDFQETPLADIVDFLRMHARINLVLDQKGIEDAEVERDKPITLALEDVPLASALHVLLDPLELSYVIKHGVLVITSPERSLSTSVYPVVDLVILKGINDYLDVSNELIDTIETLVVPDQWAANDGAGQIAFDPASASLVVTQTETVHHEIEALLANLRRSSEQLPRRAGAHAMAIDGIRDELVGKRLDAQRLDTELQLRKVESESLVQRKLHAEAHAAEAHLRELQLRIQLGEAKIAELHAAAETKAHDQRKQPAEPAVDTKKPADASDATTAEFDAAIERRLGAIRRLPPAELERFIQNAPPFLRQRIRERMHHSKPENPADDKKAKDGDKKDKDEESEELD